MTAGWAFPPIGLVRMLDPSDVAALFQIRGGDAILSGAIDAGTFTHIWATSSKLTITRSTRS